MRWQVIETHQVAFAGRFAQRRYKLAHPYSKMRPPGKAAPRAVFTSVPKKKAETTELPGGGARSLCLGSGQKCPLIDSLGLDFDDLWLRLLCLGQGQREHSVLEHGLSLFQVYGHIKRQRAREWTIRPLLEEVGYILQRWT